MILFLNTLMFLLWMFCSSFSSISAVEACMPSTSKVGPRPAGAQDRPLRPHGFWRHCGGPSLKGEGGAEGGTEGRGEGEEGWDQPHHPGKQRLHQHTQQPQRVDPSRLHQRHQGTTSAVHCILLVVFLPSPLLSLHPHPTFPLCGGDPSHWRPLHIVRAYYIYPNIFYLSACCL